MNRSARWLVVAGLGLLGCQAPPERLAVQPLAEEGQPAPFSDLLLRARGQALNATDASYVDNWVAVEDSARSLQQTARLLQGAGDIPADRKVSIDALAVSLTRQAEGLREAAKARDAQRVNSILANIHYQVRSLRPGP
jgi:hypothetical protein